MLESWWEPIKHGVRKVKFQNAEVARRKKKIIKITKGCLEQEDKQECYRTSVQGVQCNSKGRQEEGSTYQFLFLL